ncbi:proteasome accessory factor A [Candidatus Hakubella thermalkaliphila]|uniref:Pup--protein ligase n=1 Tax=Candidatus Hakubella thermalkaliphila TaxID=2754717 RepID=A0A6V8PWA0_9ACTN|nr:Pup--protein ligase [Candidatus Hakubella thermalkaliphila]GFP36728.1 proteasome accessory factor A [Candidatus Hakubella thermalkaliphila]
MKRRIFGLESEYGLTCTLNGRRRLSPDDVARYLFEKLIPGKRSSNVFLENGARLYLDIGSHPEYATPECDNIYDLVVHDKAGERVLESLLLSAEKRLRENNISGSISVFKNNTDSVGNSYGCHENYLVSRQISFQKLAQVMIPFFVTRQIYTGAGKVLPGYRDNHYFISQRAQHIFGEISAVTTSARSIINTRDEPHADAEKYRRLHVIVGDSNMSEYTTYLKVGTTALVLEMIEDNFIHQDFSLRSPVQAIREISHDPSLKRKLRLEDGCQATAIEIQRQYLELALGYLDRRDPDPLVKDVLAKWAYVLEKLEEEPRQLKQEIDWVIKRELIEAYMARHHLFWEDPRISLIDLQYHDVRPSKGLYYLLEKIGQVKRITTDEEIETAVTEPPQTTRARIRGEFIRLANKKRKDYGLGWIYLKLNDRDQKTIFCVDPFISYDERVERMMASF